MKENNSENEVKIEKEDLGQEEILETQKKAQEPKNELKEKKEKKTAKKTTKKVSATSKSNKKIEKLEKTIADLEQKNAESHDKHLRLFSEFDNFRKRTAKEKIEMSKNASADLIKDLVGIIDDIERAENAINATDSKSDSALQEGVDLIKNKLFKLLQSKGLESMESKGKEFDVEYHEALTQIPAPSEDMVGKVVDVIEKGYFLNDKVLRYAKVVVGQ